MTLYRYTGHHVQFYPDVLVPDGVNPPKVLVAHPGDEREFETPPTDGRWIELPAAKPVTPVKQVVTAKE